MCHVKMRYNVGTGFALCISETLVRQMSLNSIISFHACADPFPPPSASRMRSLPLFSAATVVLPQFGFKIEAAAFPLVDYGCTR